MGWKSNCIRGRNASAGALRRAVADPFIPLAAFACGMILGAIIGVVLDNLFGR